MAQELPQQVIQEDRDLEGSAEEVREQLAHLRWHWTLDESNPNRVSMREYARQVGRSPKQISVFANGYKAWMLRRGNTQLADEIALSGTSEKRRTAVEAVADAENVSMKTAETHRRSEVRDVMSEAEMKAERKGTSVEKEIPQVAKNHAKAKTRAAKAAKAKPTDRRVLYVEGVLAYCEGKLKKGLKELPTEGEWPDYAAGVLDERLERVETLLAFYRSNIKGETGIDWDDELAKLT